MAGDGVGDEGLGVDGSAEMHVEVGAFGHVDQEGMERERAGGVGLCGVEGAHGAGFLCGGGRRSDRLRLGVRRECDGGG